MYDDMPSAGERAANGRALLDEEGPLGWRYALDRDMNMFWDCVLDRVYGDYSDGLGALGIRDSATRYGFCPAERPGDSEALKAAWLAEAAVPAEEEETPE